MVNVGGFFASLSLKGDKVSFDNTHKMVEAMQKDIQKTGQEFGSFVANAVKGLGAIGAAAIGAAAAVSMIQAKSAIAATRANVSTIEFVNFGNAIKMLSGNADGFIASMAGMQSAFDNIKIGDSAAFEAMAKNLALLQTATGVSLSVNDLMGMTQGQRVMALTSAAEKTDYKTEAGRNSLTLLDKMVPGISDALIQARNAGKTFSQVYAEANQARSTDASTYAGSAKNAYEINKLGVVGSEIFGSGLEKILTALRPTIERISAYLIKHEPDFDKFFTDIGKLIDSIANGPLGKAALGAGEKVGQVIDAVANNPQRLQDRIAFERSPEGKKLKADVRSSFEKSPWGSLKMSEDMAFKAAELYAMQGKDYTAGITQKEINEANIPSTVNVGGINIAMTPEAYALAVANIKSGNYNPLDKSQSAAQMAVIALHMDHNK